METKKRSIPAIVFSIIGLLINAVYLIPAAIKERAGHYENYIENLDWFGEDEYTTIMRQQAYREYDVIIIFCLICCAVYLLTIIYQKAKPLYTIIPILGAVTLAAVSYIEEVWTFADDYYYYISIGLFVVASVLTIIGAAKNKAGLSVFAAILAIIGIVIVFTQSSYLVQIVSYGNIVGSEAICFFVLLMYRKPKEKKQKTQAKTQAKTQPIAQPATQQTEQQAEQPIPQQTALPNISSSILECDTLIIDEKISIASKSFRIYNEQGEQIGTVGEKVSGGGQAARALLGKGVAVLQSSQLFVCDMYGNTLFGTCKKGITGSITDANGNIMYTLKKGVLMDQEGNAVMRFRSTLKAGDYVENTEGEVVARFKKAFFTAKAAFTSADKYTITITPGTSTNQRMLAIGTVLIWEMITGNK